MDYILYTAIYNYINTNRYPEEATIEHKRRIRRNASKYQAYHNKLFRKTPSRTIGQELLHQGIAEQVITRVHEEGHTGINNTWRRLQTQYTGPKLFEIVQKVVRTCITCQMRSKKPHKRTETARPIPTPAQPFYLIGCDAVGPLKVSKNGYRYILVAIDYLTRWPIAAPVRNINEKTTAQFLYNEVVANYGVPSYILTDQGRNFTSEHVRSFLTLLNCRHLTTTAYRPQTNGLCERMNQTIVQVLAKITRDAEAQERWDEYIKPALLAIRTTPNDTTRLTPAKLLFGYDMRTPATWNPPTKRFIGNQYQEDITRRTKVIKDLTSNLYKEAQRLSRTRQEKDKLRYDRNVRKPKRFCIGEQVLMRDHVPPSKLADRWLGPMTVTRVYNNGTYQLTGPNYRRLQKAINGDNLIPFAIHYSLVPIKENQLMSTQFQAWLQRHQHGNTEASNSENQDDDTSSSLAAA
ncbi:hypothetical protein INT47_009223 [Mucor saturninus]|uniref:Integrase catalytic domain-containing protein n=1 Tax=Mucor saturninus TaxID=64648 RepID=A0A8H7QGC2_9FUNG|nr:hypothetical protein INT47_009223 [Mucor saturninus]